MSLLIFASVFIFVVVIRMTAWENVQCICTYGLQNSVSKVGTGGARTEYLYICMSHIRMYDNSLFLWLVTIWNNLLLSQLIIGLIYNNLKEFMRRVYFGTRSKEFSSCLIKWDRIWLPVESSCYVRPHIQCMQWLHFFLIYYFGKFRLICWNK